MPRGSVRRRHGPGCPARGGGGRCRCDGAWQIRFRDGLGRRFERGGFTTKEDAERALAEAVRAIDRGSFAEFTPIGFADFAARWIETSARPNTKSSTCRDYEGSIRNHLVPYFGDVELRRITREMVQRYMADKAASRKADGTPTWSPKTINGTTVPCARCSATRSRGATWTRARPRRSGRCAWSRGSGRFSRRPSSRRCSMPPRASTP